MSEQWYYAKDGQRMGPVQEEDMQKMVASGDIAPSDMIWSQGMESWTPASKIFPPPVPNPNAPPPLPVGSSSTRSQSNSTDIAKLLNLDNRILLGYRIAILFALLAAFFPWSQVSASTTSSFLSQARSISLSKGGLETIPGILTLIVAIGAIIVSFMNPASFMKDKAMIGMAAFGGAVAFLAIIGIATAKSHFPVPEFNTNSDSISVNAGLGAFLALISGTISMVLGLINKWEE